MGVFNKIHTSLLGMSTKVNPIQPSLATESGETRGSSLINRRSVEDAYINMSTAQRAVNLLCESLASLRLDVKDRIPNVSAVRGGVKRSTVNSILNYQPNPHQDAFTFKVQLFYDFLTEGNIFSYFDGRHIYRIPPSRLTIVPDTIEWIKRFEDSAGRVDFDPDEIIFVRDNGPDMYRGESRVRSVMNEIDITLNLSKYLNNYFENGIAPGSIFYTESILSRKAKLRYEQDLQTRFDPKTRGHRPLVVDGNFKYQAISTERFDVIPESIGQYNNMLLQGLGIPPVILAPTNNVQARPAQELFYHNTVIPIFRKFLSTLENFFGYDLDIDTTKVLALAPDRKSQADELSTLTNNGIITGDEARVRLRLEPIGTPEMTTIRIPANVAGSAAGGSNEGAGRPENEENDTT